MEIRDFTGSFVVDGRETEVIELRVLLSTGGGGEVHGSGSFSVPSALIGAEANGPLTFRCHGGEEMSLEVREFDLTNGIAYFLTQGAVPVIAKRA